MSSLDGWTAYVGVELAQYAIVFLLASTLMAFAMRKRGQVSTLLRRPFTSLVVTLFLFFVSLILGLVVRMIEVISLRQPVYVDSLAFFQVVIIEGLFNRLSAVALMVCFAFLIASIGRGAPGPFTKIATGVLYGISIATTGLTIAIFAGLERRYIQEYVGGNYLDLSHFWRVDIALSVLIFVGALLIMIFSAVTTNNARLAAPAHSPTLHKITSKLLLAAGLHLIPWVWALILTILLYFSTIYLGPWVDVVQNFLDLWVRFAVMAIIYSIGKLQLDVPTHGGYKEPRWRPSRNVWV